MSLRRPGVILPSGMKTSRSRQVLCIVCPRLPFLEIAGIRTTSGLGASGLRQAGD